MTFEAEWAELKRESSVGVKPAGAGGENWGSQGGEGDLRSARQAWSKGARALGSLHVNLKGALRQLEGKQHGAGSGVEGLRSTASHLSAYHSWQRRIDLVSRECEELKGKLQKAGDAFYKTDAAISEAFQEQRTVPATAPGASTSTRGRGES
ncbi:hypothetical protein [Streptomyces sp. NPDC058773]|uniref:hypothetical protein n=1 Tax=Streptomyces sp. NPDC058773 TaxID=3346632 RepID=UPI00368733D4